MFQFYLLNHNAPSIVSSTLVYLRQYWIFDELSENDKKKVANKIFDLLWHDEDSSVSTALATVSKTFEYLDPDK